MTAKRWWQDFELLSFLFTDGVKIESPLRSVDFLDNMEQILRTKFTATTLEQCMDPAGNGSFRLFFFSLQPS